LRSEAAMKKLLFLALALGGSYAGWQRYERARDVAPDVEFTAAQVGSPVAESYILFQAVPIDDGRFLGVEGPAGANVLTMTARMGYQVWKTNPDFIVNCRTPAVQDIVNTFVGLTLLSDNPKGRRELASMAASFGARAKSGGKRLCMKLEGNELTGVVAIGGNIATKTVRATRFETMDCGDMIAGM
jgi:hypothetical protein